MEVIDNWWPAIRHTVMAYKEFKEIFKAKYWSESIQNTANDNLYNGKFNPIPGKKPTVYFFGKINIARHLEPKIPEECLATKLT